MSNYKENWLLVSEPGFLARRTKLFKKANFESPRGLRTVPQSQIGARGLGWAKGEFKRIAKRVQEKSVSLKIIILKKMFVLKQICNAFVKFQYQNDPY